MYADADFAAADDRRAGCLSERREYCATCRRFSRPGRANITLDCPIDGVMGLQIAGLPEGMTQEEAEQLVYSDEFYTVRGPWSFPVTFDQ
jgi:hypothetical protein